MEELKKEIAALLDKAYANGRQDGYDEGFQAGHGAALTNLGIHVTEEDAMKAVKDDGRIHFTKYDVYELISSIFKSKE